MGGFLLVLGDRFAFATGLLPVLRIAVSCRGPVRRDGSLRRQSRHGGRRLIGRENITVVVRAASGAVPAVRRWAACLPAGVSCDT